MAGYAKALAAGELSCAALDKLTARLSEHLELSDIPAELLGRSLVREKVRRLLPPCRSAPARVPHGRPDAAAPPEAGLRPRRTAVTPR